MKLVKSRCQFWREQASTLYPKTQQDSFPYLLPTTEIKKHFIRVLANWQLGWVKKDKILVPLYTESIYRMPLWTSYSKPTVKMTFFFFFKYMVRFKIIEHDTCACGGTGTVEHSDWGHAHEETRNNQEEV